MSSLLSYADQFLFTPPLEHWETLVEVAYATIGVKGETPGARSARPLKKRRESLWRTSPTMEPMYDGAKTALILADAVVQELKKTVPDEWPLEPTDEGDKRRRERACIYYGIRRAAERAAELLTEPGKPWSLDEADGGAAWSELLQPGSELQTVLQGEPAIKELVAVPESEMGAYRVAETMRVDRGLYTFPLRVKGGYDEWRTEVRLQNLYVVIYDAPITQTKTLQPVLDYLRSGQAGEEATLVIITDEISDQALRELDKQAEQAFSYLALPTPPHSRDRRASLDALVEFTGAQLLPEDGIDVTLDEATGEDDWLIVTVPFEPGKEPQVQPEHLGENLSLVSVNRQRTLLVRKEGEADEDKMWGASDWPQADDAALWQVQTTHTVAVELTEPLQEWQKRADADVTQVIQAQQAISDGWCAGSGAALVWVQERLDFDEWADEHLQNFDEWASRPWKKAVDAQQRAGVQRGWQAFKAALEAPLAAIVSKAGVTKDSEPYRTLVEGIQKEERPIVGYKLEAAQDGDYQLGPIARLSDDNIMRYAVPAPTVAQLVRTAATMARGVLNMYVWTNVGAAMEGGTNV